LTKLDAQSICLILRKIIILARHKYTIVYHSTKPSTEPGFRRVQVTAEAKGQGKLNVRTRTGYLPVVRKAKKSTPSQPE
jgi:Ca-activated chloride channel homolog